MDVVGVRTSSGSVPWVESYLSRWALVAGGTRSLTATTSMSATRQRGPQEVPADPPKPVDAYPNCHQSLLVKATHDQMVGLGELRLTPLLVECRFSLSGVP